MKRKATFLTLLLFSVTVFAGKIVTKDVNMLPDKAQEFITTYFPKLVIQKIEIEDELFESKTYEVDFTNGYEVSFDSKGMWYDVDCKKEEVPQAIVPTGIKEYLKVNFPGDIITQIEKERGGYEVELQSDLTLKFDKNGNFKKIDD